MATVTPKSKKNYEKIISFFWQIQLLGPNLMEAILRKGLWREIVSQIFPYMKDAATPGHLQQLLLFHMYIVMVGLPKPSLHLPPFYLPSRFPLLDIEFFFMTVSKM